MVGDDEQVPLAERPQARELFEMADPVKIGEAHVGIISPAVPRVSPLHEVVRSAAGPDTDVH